MIEQSFADEIGGISIREGLVRIDLVSYPPNARDKDGNPAAVFSGRLIMTIPDMLRSFDKMREVMQKLVEQGIVVRNEEPQARPQVAQDEGLTAKTMSGTVTSPNFPGQKK